MITPYHWTTSDNRPIPEYPTSAMPSNSTSEGDNFAILSAVEFDLSQVRSNAFTDAKVIIYILRSGLRTKQFCEQVHKSVWGIKKSSNLRDVNNDPNE